MLRFKPLNAIGVAIIKEINPSISNDILVYLDSVMDSYISGGLTFDNASNIFTQTIGNASPIFRINQILSVSPTPLRDVDYNDIKQQMILRVYPFEFFLKLF